MRSRVHVSVSLKKVGSGMGRSPVENMLAASHARGGTMLTKQSADMMGGSFKVVSDRRNLTCGKCGVECAELR